MNILFLSELFYPHGSGAELATYLYADLLNKSGFNVRVITNRFACESDFSKNGNMLIYRLSLFKNSENVKYSILSRVDVLFSSFLNKMMKWADVVYVPRFWFSAILMAKARGKPVVTHLHDYIPICPLAGVYDFSNNVLCEGNKMICSPGCTYCREKIANRPIKEVLASVILNSTFGSFFSRTVQLSDAIVCVSNSQKAIISTNEAFSSNKLFVVHNPVPNFPDLPMKSDDFGYFGGIDKLKGFQTLREAMVTLNACSSKHINVHSTKIPQVNKQCLNSLTKLGFSLYGKLEKRMYEEIYQNIRTVIVPSIWPEPWPYVVVEALLRGRFVIASRIGGIPEQVDTCKGVTLFEAGNSEKLREAMNNVLCLNREAIADLGFQNRDSFLKRFSNESSLKQFINILENVD